MLHTCLTGRTDHESYAPCNLSGLKSKGYDYWALGHVHTHEIVSEEPLVVYPGNIQGRHVRESGPKGCVLVTVDDNDQIKTEFLELDVIRWHVMDVDVAGAQSGYELVDQFGDALDRLIAEDPSRPMVVRITFSGETSVHDRILGEFEHWVSEIRSIALTTGAGQVWVEKIRFQTHSPADVKKIKEGDGAIAELVNYLNLLKNDETQLLELADDLQDLDKKIPRELKTGAESIDFADPLWLKNLLGQIEPMLIRRLVDRKGDQ